jgi:hypothetical protein
LIFFWALAISSLVVLFSCLSTSNKESFSAVSSSSLCAERERERERERENPQATGRSEMLVTNRI